MSNQMQVMQDMLDTIQMQQRQINILRAEVQTLNESVVKIAEILKGLTEIAKRNVDSY